MATAATQHGLDGIRIDDREYQRALVEYMKVSKSTLERVINRRAYFIIRKAIKLLPAVTIPDMTAEIGSPRKPTPLMLKIVNKRFTRKHRGLAGGARVRYSKKTGRKYYTIPLRNMATVKDEAEKIIRARRRSWGWLASGWARAASMFARKAGKRSMPYRKARRRLTQEKKSDIEYARPSWNPVAKMVYKSLVGPKRSKSVSPLVVKTLRDAMRMETRSMKAETLKRMNALGRKHSAK